jgi:hypothetical protein
VPGWAVLVVVLAEGVELALQLAQGGSGQLPGQPAFSGLVESLDLALGLRVVRGRTDQLHRQMRRCCLLGTGGRKLPGAARISVDCGIFPVSQQLTLSER